MPPVERSASPATAPTPPTQPSASPHSAEPNKPLTGDTITPPNKTKERIHLAGSISMIAMLPLMAGMMLMPSHKSNSSGGTSGMGGMMM